MEIGRKKSTGQKTERKPAGRRLLLRGGAGLLAALCLAGCGQGASLSGGRRSERGYGLPEILVIAMTEKNRYEEVCTDQIWSVPVEGEGNFEDYLKKEIRAFMDELRAMTLLAGERGISLSAEERSAMSGAAEEYYSLLTEADIQYMGVELEDIQGLYEDYCLAEKLVEEVTGGMNLEVSDSEAKVIVIRQAAAADESTAALLSAAAAVEGADFGACAEQLGLSVTERSLGRGEEPAGIENAAFALAQGQVSAPVEADGSWYVLYCVDDYDEAATEARKKLIFDERRRRAFQEIYEEFRGSLEITYSGFVWDEFSLASDNYAEAADFFEIYGEYAQ